MTVSQAKINFTGRQTIRHEQVALEIEADDHAIRVTGRVDLSDLNVPDDAIAIVELYREIYSERRKMPMADLGQLDLRFSPHPAPTTLLCNLRIVSPTEPGLILAAAERVRPDASTELGGRSLLPIEVGELGDGLWRLELGDVDTQPVLLLNQRLDDPDRLARDRRFQLLVFPAILREIGAWLANELSQGGSSEEGPVAQWAAFFEGLGVTPAVTEDDLPGNPPAWIDDGVDRFVSRIGAVSAWNSLDPSDGAEA